MAHIAILSILLLLMTFGNTINAGITRQLDQMLPNNERITRSIHNPVEDDGKSLETIPVEDTYTKHRRLDRPVRSANAYDLDAAENNVVFKPLFRKRPNRRVRRAAPDDLTPAENNIVFKPLFRRKPNRRVARSANEQLTRERRDAQDDMQTAENNIVFKPLFRRQPVRRVRSLGDLESAKSQYASYYGHDEKADDDNKSESEEETKKADDAINAEVDEVAEETRFKREASENGDELMDTAANTIVFRPLFRNNRRYVNRQRN